MSDSSVNILMTGGGAPGAPGILKCLLQQPSFRITVADANESATCRYLHPDFEIIPKADAPDFIEKISFLCRRKNIHVLMPLVTRELFPLSLHKSKLEATGVKVLVSDFTSLEIANNKSRLYEFLQWRGMEVPEFRIVETIEQFEQAVKDLNYPQHEVCFKPSVSNGSRGFRIMSKNIDEMDLLFNYKPNSTYISYSDAVRILSSDRFPELLISEYLPGEEYSVDCLAKNGEPVVIVPRIRRKMMNGISVEGEFTRNEEIINYCSEVIKELKLHGNIGIQVKRSREGKFLILEINPRVQGTIVAGLGAGINLPALAVKQELDLQILPAELEVKWGTKFSRYWSEVFY